MPSMAAATIAACLAHRSPPPPGVADGRAPPALTACVVVVGVVVGMGAAAAAAGAMAVTAPIPLPLCLPVPLLLPFPLPVPVVPVPEGVRYNTRQGGRRLGASHHHCTSCFPTMSCVPLRPPQWRAPAEGLPTAHAQHPRPPSCPGALHSLGSGHPGGATTWGSRLRMAAPPHVRSGATTPWQEPPTSTLDGSSSGHKNSNGEAGSE